MDQKTGVAGILLQHRPQIEAFLRARLGPWDAEEVLQEVWMKAATLDPAGIADPLAYLYRMAENAARSYRRSAQRWAQRNSEWAAARTAQRPLAEADAGPNPEDELIARERLRRVEAALATLPRRTSDIFRDFRVEGKGQKLIAAEQGISISAVEKHLQRAYRLIVEVRAELDAESEAP